MNVPLVRRSLLFARATVRGRAMALEAKLRGRRPLHFLHIAKTGGTAIKHALEGHSLTRDFRVILHDHAYTLNMVPAGETAAFCVRDPVARFRSGFEDRYREAQPRYYYPWTKQEKSRSREFKTAQELALALGSRGSALRELAEDAMRTIQHVRETYHWVFGGLEGLKSRIDRVSFVGFQDDLAGSFERFKNFLVLPADLSLPQDDFSAHRHTGVRTPFSDAAIENLREWYAEDYRIYDFLCDNYR